MGRSAHGSGVSHTHTHARRRVALSQGWVTPAFKNVSDHSETQLAWIHFQRPCYERAMANHRRGSDGHLSCCACADHLGPPSASACLPACRKALISHGFIRPNDTDAQAMAECERVSLGFPPHCRAPSCHKVRSARLGPVLLSALPPGSLPCFLSCWLCCPNFNS